MIFTVARLRRVYGYREGVAVLVNSESKMKSDWISRCTMHCWMH